MLFSFIMFMETQMLKKPRIQNPYTSRFVADRASADYSTFFKVATKVQQSPDGLFWIIKPETKK